MSIDHVTEVYVDPSYLSTQISDDVNVTVKKSRTSLKLLLNSYSKEY